MRHFFLLAALLIGIALSPTASAVEGAPSLIDYQGSVFDDQGNPLAPIMPALYKMEFRIWDQIGAGNLIWAEQQTVTVYKGQFSIRLGEGTATTGDTVAPRVPHNQLPLAFEGSSRFLGVTIVTNPAAKMEITPRVAFLTTPYAHVANTASVVVQQAGTSSSVLLGGIGYATRKEDSGAATVNLTIDQRTNLIAAGAAGTTANLPEDGDNHELLISKTDDTPYFVTIAPPAGGQINGSNATIRLKVKGESVTVQHSDGDNWWVVDDTRDNTPVGTIVSFGADEPPAGYFPCDGRSLTRAEYAELFTAIGSNWGAADGTQFNLPDLTGRFLRGIDPANNGADDDATTRVSLYAGGATGRAVGSYQLDVLKNHIHPVTDKKHSHPIGNASASLTLYTAGYGADDHFMASPSGDRAAGFDLTPSYSLSLAPAANLNLTVRPAGGTETRPDNAGVRYCIKY